MRGILAILLVVLVCVLSVSSAPSPKGKWGIKESLKEEGLYPSGRSRPASRRTSDTISSQQGQGPYVFFREPRAQQQQQQWDPSWQQKQKPIGNRPAYWQWVERGRDDDEDDDEDEVQDDEGDSEEEDEEFDTPEWDEMFPPSETGPYDKTRSNTKKVKQVIPVQQDEGSYTLAAGSPGTPGYKGRSEGPWWQWQGQQQQRVAPWARRQGHGQRRWAKQNVVERQWEGQGPVVPSKKWTGTRRNFNPGHVYYKSQYIPSPVRRNWQWQQWQRPVPVSSSSEESVEAVVPWAQEGQGQQQWDNQQWVGQSKVWDREQQVVPRRIQKKWSNYKRAPQWQRQWQRQPSQQQWERQQWERQPSPQKKWVYYQNE